MGMLQPAKAYVPPVASPPMKSGTGPTGPGSVAMAYGVPSWTISRNPQRFMKEAQELYRTNLWISAAEGTVSDRFAGVDYHLEDADDNEIDDDSPEEYRRVRDLIEKPLGDERELIRQLGFKPQSPSTRRGLWKLTGRHMGLCGISHWYLDETDLSAGTPLRTFYINPARMTPALDKAGNLTGYTLDYDGREGTGTPLDLDEVLTFVLEPADWGHGGIGLVERAWTMAQLGGLVDRHAMDSLASGGRLAGMVMPKEGWMTDEQYDELVRNFRHIAEMPDAAKRTAILKGPIEFVSNTATPQQLSLIDLSNLTRDNLLALWGTPLSQLGGPTAAGFNSGERPKYDEATLWQNGVGPRLDSFGETLQYQLFDRWKKLGVDIELEIEVPEFDDDAPMYEIASKATDLPLTRNERRNIIKLDPFPDWNPDGTPNGIRIDLPAMLVEAGQGPTDEPQPVPEVAETAAPEPETPAVAPIDDEPLLAPDDAAPPLFGKARTVSLGGIRKSVETRYAPAIRKAVQAVLDEQRTEVAAKVAAHAAHIAAKPKETTVWWDQKKWDKRLLEALRPHAAAIGGAVSDQVAKQLASHRPAGKAVTPAVMTRLLADVATRVVGINRTTRDDIAAVIGGNLGLGGAELGQLVSAATAFGAPRAEVIARTESAQVLNAAQLGTFGQFGISQVEAIDGDEDPECAERNGQVFDIEEAMAIEDHPNGTLDWAPVIP